MSTKLQRYPKVFSDNCWHEFCEQVGKISDEKEGVLSDAIENAIIVLGKMCLRLELIVRDLERRVAELEDQ